jgi:Mala s 1-like protein/WD40 repeat protein
VIVGARRSVLRGLVRMWGVLAAGRGGAGERLHSCTSIALALCVAGALALCAGVAQAEPPRLISYGQFNSHTPLPIGVAVDQSSNAVYAAGFLNLSNFSSVPVNKFDASGALLAPPSPFGQGYHSGAAVNPINGDVYVLSNVIPFFGGAPVVDTYDPNSGALLSSFPVAESNNVGGGIATVVQIAADSAGNVYVPVVPQNEVLEYSSTGTLLNTFTGGSGAGALKGPTGVAVDSSGNLWVADMADNRVEELSSSDAPVGEIRSEGVESVALDGHGDVFAVVRNRADFCGEVQPPCQHLVEYSSAGAQVADVGAGSFGNQSGGSAPSMVAVNEATGRVYVTDGFKELVWIFGPPTPPVVGRELTAEVTTSEAKLGALVGAGGLPASYRFEYGVSSAYGQSTPFPEGSVGEGIVSRTVWAAASGLVPGVTYHYRVVASNELGVVYGPDRTFTTLTAVQAACPNGEVRGGFSVRLPDCRAYELVTPPPVNSSQVWSAQGASVGGGAFAFFTEEPLPGSPTGGGDYLVRRGSAGWSEEDVIPLESYSALLCSTETKGSGVVAYSAEMSKAIVTYGKFSRASAGEPGQSKECNAEGLQVVQGEPVGYENLLVRDNATGGFRLVNGPPVGVTPADAHFKGASADLSHIVFTEESPLAPGAQYGVENLFEWDEGVVRLLTVLPDGSPVSGSLATRFNGEVPVKHPISADGSHILFTSGGGLFDRIDGQRTVPIDEKQVGAAGPSGGGVLQTASMDGSTVFFTDESRLTVDSTAEAGEPDLYECELVEEAGKTVCKLSDLTVAKAGEHADVIGVSGLGSQDGSHVYFTAKGVLATNKREYEYVDAEGKAHEASEEAKNGENNLYLDQAGSIVFIATLSPVQEVNGEITSAEGRGVVSPDGTWFAFVSRKSLTGYDNVLAGAVRPVEEVFLYDAVTGGLECASCVPSGEAPVAVGAGLPGVDERPLSDGGRLFFETEEALVPSDTNGRVDVYEYENGQPSLISSGASSDKSLGRVEGAAGHERLFVGASESGSDVFFLASQQLVPQDTNEDAIVVYDARVGGGFAAVASPPACTTADACRSAVSPQPSSFGAPSSQTFSGVGNLTPSSEGKARKKARPKGKRKAGHNACRRLRNKQKRAVCKARQSRQDGRRMVKSDRRGK